MNEIKITIAGVDYRIKQSFRALMLFEKLAGKKVAFAEDSVGDTLMMFYALLKANNKDFEFSFEQFVDLVDDNQESVEVFVDYLQSIAETPTPTSEEKKTNN